MTMFDRSTRLRLRRSLRRRQRQVESFGEAAEDQLEHNLIGRFYRLRPVWRFVTGWLLLAVLMIIGTVAQTLGLSGYYQTLKPIPGGAYNEGMVGTYSNANPIYALGPVNTAVSHLIFAGLFTYDDHNQLVGDLASSYSVDSTGKLYTVHLRPDLVWQDGRPLTADDVAFTYHTIQDPDASSPFISNWQGITVTAVGRTTVTFALPNPLSSFPYTLTNGIVPQHVLAQVPAAQLRSSDFNTIHPVGAGPFAWQAIQLQGSDPAATTTLIALQPFNRYHAGVPKLDAFVVKAYSSTDQLLKAFDRREVNAMAGLDTVPKSLQGAANIHIYSFPLSAAVMTFFKTSSGVLSDTSVRQALVRGTDTKAILDELPFTAQAVTEPLLTGQLGYNPQYQQATLDLAAANAQLTADGWVVGKDGLRSKDGQLLQFDMYAPDTAENELVSKLLAKQWRRLGIAMRPVLQNSEDFQNTLQFHAYDALLYGISIGVDPDVFVYWDSSQADVRSSNRLNFSEYKSTAADAALEAGRTRLDPQLRVIKYAPFLEAWQKDAPAVALYQPRSLYITRELVAGLNEHTLNIAADRYNSVVTWETRTARITN